VTVRVQLFAILKERAGQDHVEVELPDSATVADAIAAVAQLPGLAGLSHGSARMAVNREYAASDTLLRSGDELALIPPVSGGDAVAHLVRATETVHASVTGEPLDLARLIEFVENPHAGAVVTFQGMPRDIATLDYEAYAEMALEKIEAILADCVERFGLCAAAAEHRVGSVPAREASIAIAVSAPHRTAAFDGAHAALDRIKAEAPIWKVEVDDAGGRQRVNGVLPA
jgi:molybdopterin converting factor subunit 1